MKERTKQRKQRWFQVRTGVAAAVGTTKLGTITAISRSGLTVSCFDFSVEGEKGRSGPSDSTELSIIHDDGFSLYNVPCKILEEDSAPSQNYFDSLNINHCRLQFGQLTKAQKSQLEYFFDYFTDRPIDQLLV